MAKKDFSQDLMGTDAFFSNISLNPAPAEKAPARAARPAAAKPAPEPEALPEAPAPVDGRRRKGPPSFMFSLKLPLEWREVLSDAAWRRRTTVTGLINTIIGEWIEKQEGRK